MSDWRAGFAFTTGTVGAGHGHESQVSLHHSANNWSNNEKFDLTKQAIDVPYTYNITSSTGEKERAYLSHTSYTSIRSYWFVSPLGSMIVFNVFSCKETSRREGRLANSSGVNLVSSIVKTMVCTC